MDVSTLYALGTVGWFTFQAIPLLINPRSTLQALLQDQHTVTNTDVILSRATSIVLLAGAVFALAASNVVPVPFLTRKSPTSPSSTATAEHTPLLAATTPIHVCLAALYYLNYPVPGTSTVLLWMGMMASSLLAALGGGLYMFGSGAGSDKKMRSHMVFETPEHRKEVKERHKAKKGL